MPNIASQGPEGDVREFDFTDDHFNKITKLVFDKTGINIAPHKKNMVYGRMAKRLRSIGLSNIDEYLNLLKTLEGKEEISNFINAVTTNLTHFFREIHHLTSKKCWNSLCHGCEQTYKKNSAFGRLVVLQGWSHILLQWC